MGLQLQGRRYSLQCDVGSERSAGSWAAPAHIPATTRADGGLRGGRSGSHRRTRAAAGCRPEVGPAHRLLRARLAQGCREESWSEASRHHPELGRCGRREGKAQRARRERAQAARPDRRRRRRHHCRQARFAPEEGRPDHHRGRSGEAQRYGQLLDAAVAIRVGRCVRLGLPTEPCASGTDDRDRRLRNPGEPRRLRQRGACSSAGEPGIAHAECSG